MLKRVRLVLIDSRHGVEAGVDRRDSWTCSTARPSATVVVLTKADKIKAIRELAEVQAATRSEDVRKRAGGAPRQSSSTSAEKGMGLPDLRAAVLEAIG